MINRVDRRSQLECLKQCGELLKQVRTNGLLERQPCYREGDVRLSGLVWFNSLAPAPLGAQLHGD